MQKDKALEMALGQIEKQYGKGAIMLMGDAASRIQVSVIPTGCIELDAALGVGGVPRGRIVEIYGPESSGKTTIALHIIAEAQKMGGMCVFIDAEHALDPVYAEKLGISMDKLYVSQPDNGEQALDIADALVRSGAIDDMGDSHVGLQARLMSQALRKLAGVVGKSRTCVIFINQLREKVGVMFGNPETTTGGKALKFFASIRLDVRKIDTLKQGNSPVGNRTRIKVVKNKVAPPFRVAEFDIIYGEGVSKEGSILDMGVANKIITKTGAWFSYGDIRIGQGRENARNFLRDNPELCKEIEKKLRDLIETAHDETAPVSEDEPYSEDE